MAEDKGFLLFLDGKIRLDDFVKYIEKNNLLSEFVQYLIYNYKPDYFENAELFFRRTGRVLKFCFPVVSQSTGELNYGFVAFTDFEAGVISNHTEAGINSLIKDITGGENCVVVFKDNQFKGFSFSGALYTALKLGKDVDRVAISFEVDSKGNVFDVSKVSVKKEVAKLYGIPVVTAADFMCLDDAVFLVDTILSHMSVYVDVEPKEIDISKKWLMFGYDTGRLKTQALSVVKYLHSQGIPAVILDKVVEGIKTGYRIFAGKNSDNRGFLRDSFMVITDDMDTALSLNEHSILHNLEEVDSLYALIDSYVRDAMVKDGIDAGLIDRIISLTGYYPDGIPAEKLNPGKLPDFLYEEGLLFKFRDVRVRDYFLARFFVESATDEERNLILDFYGEGFLRFVVYHPEFLKLNLSIKNRIIRSFYNSSGFRGIYKKENDLFLYFAASYGIEDIYVYEKIKQAYSEADYGKAIDLLNRYPYVKKTEVIKTNILIDLWALDEAEVSIKNLDSPYNKKCGQLIYLYLKKLDFEKVFYYAKEKMQFERDEQKESYHILAMAYGYRLNHPEVSYDSLVNLFEKYLRTFEIGYKAGNYNKEGIYYLIRNFSYSLVYHDAYEKYFLDETQVDTVKPLYPFLINYSYVKRDIDLLRKLSAEEFFEKQPLENLAALAAMADLTGSLEDVQIFHDRYQKLVDRYNHLLSGFGVSTQLIPYDGDIKEFFRKIVYVQ